MDAATTTPSLTERYVDAAMRTVPERQRGDASAELRASIEDSIEARMADGESADAAERTVLIDLGDPARLAAEYADRPLTLIGPRYFLDWWRLLKLLLWIAPPIVVTVQVLVQALGGESTGQIIGSAAATAVLTIVQVGFWVTLAFAILEWTQPDGKAPLLPWSLDQLPEMRQPGLGRGDMIASVVFLVLAVGALVWDRLIGFVIVAGESIPIIDPALWPWSLLVLLPVAIAEGALAVAVYRRGRWTPALAAINTALAVAVAVPVIWLIVGGMLVNPTFVDAFTAGAEIAPIAAIVISVAVAMVSAWDAFDGWFKVWRARGA